MTRERSDRVARKPSGPVLGAIWGKTRALEVGSEHHPLLGHLLDTAGVATAIWDTALGPTTRHLLAAGLGVPETDARTWAIALATLHDLGKCSPAFQLATLPDDDGAHQVALLAAGLTVAPPIPPARHGEIVADTIIDPLVGFGVPRRVAVQLATLLGGHHGVFPADGHLCDQGSLGDERWAAARRAHVAAVAAALELGRAAAPTIRLTRPAAIVLAGFVTVSDWIASNADYFPLSVPGTASPPFDDDPAERYAIALERAARALAQLGWSGFGASAATVSFASLFGVPAPRPVQEVAIELAETIAPPALAVLEVPTGEGKTEAALWLADRWSAARGVRGMYLALPTMTTSDQMFSRVRDVMRRRYPGEATELQLLHGHAALSADFALLREAADRLAFEADVVCAEDAPDGTPARVVASAWFTAAKRGLLAPIGVGTIDQALLAALVTPHVFVRLFGLAGKTLVLDEVHAYDAYMGSLIELLLEWCAALGSPVVLLSATLPDERRRAFLAAYARGAGWPADPAALPAAAYPRVSAISSAGASARSVATSTLNHRTLALAEAPADPEALAALAEQLTADGGCLAVLCNTVPRAQAVFGAIAARLRGRAADGGPPAGLSRAGSGPGACRPWEGPPDVPLAPPPRPPKPLGAPRSRGRARAAPDDPLRLWPGPRGRRGPRSFRRAPSDRDQLPQSRDRGPRPVARDARLDEASRRRVRGRAGDEAGGRDICLDPGRGHPPVPPRGEPDEGGVRARRAGHTPGDHLGRRAGGLARATARPCWCPHGRGRAPAAPAGRPGPRHRDVADCRPLRRPPGGGGPGGLPGGPGRWHRRRQGLRDGAAHGRSWMTRRALSIEALAQRAGVAAGRRTDR